MPTRIVSELLRIKKYREEKAELAVSRAREALEDATTALKEARGQAREFTDECTRREQALYVELCAKPVRRLDIEDVAMQVGAMREQMQAYEKKVEEAQQQRQERVQRLEAAKQAYRDATRQREKFTELQSQLVEERRIEEGRLEDIELEEVPRPAKADADSPVEEDAVAA